MDHRPTSSRGKHVEQEVRIVVRHRVLGKSKMLHLPPRASGGWLDPMRRTVVLAQLVADILDLAKHGEYLAARAAVNGPAPRRPDGAGVAGMALVRPRLDLRLVVARGQEDLVAVRRFDVGDQQVADGPVGIAQGVWAGTVSSRTRIGRPHRSSQRAFAKVPRSHRPTCMRIRLRNAWKTATGLN